MEGGITPLITRVDDGWILINHKPYKWNDFARWYIAGIGVAQTESLVPKIVRSCAVLPDRKFCRKCFSDNASDCAGA